MAIVDRMTVVGSPEIDAVVRRVLGAYTTGDVETISNLFSSDPSLRVLGFDEGEWWEGPDDFLSVLGVASNDWPERTVEIDKIEAFEDGDVGWATAFTTLTTPATTTTVRHVATVRIEAGAWKVIQWHNSIPVPNEQIWGVEITTTLGDLVASVLHEETHLTPGAGTEGTMTLVFTDIVDSTRLAESVGDNAWIELIRKHESRIREITTYHDGAVVKLLGDGSMLAFQSARAAVRAAIGIQRASNSSFAVRIGIHTGEIIRTRDDLFGTTVNKAARVAAAAEANEIMISPTTRDLVGSMDGVHMAPPKIVALKGLSDTHQIVRVEWD